MINRVKHVGSQTAHSVHERVFGHAMGDRMKGFLHSLSWSFFGGTIASGMLFIATVLSGRWLGPAEYGKVGFIQALALTLSTVILFGLDIASIRAISRNHDQKDQKTYFAASLITFAVVAFVSLVILWVLAAPLARILATTTTLFYAGMGFALVMALKNLFDGYLRGLHDFKTQAYTKIIESGLIIIGFVILFFAIKPPTYLHFIGPVIAGGLIFAAINAVQLRHMFDFTHQHLVYARALLSYGKLATLASLVSLIVLQGDKVIINRYLGIYELGIYTAYYTAAIVPISQLIMIVGNVFFPIIARTHNKQATLTKLDRIFGLGLVPLSLCVACVMTVVLWLFGSNYPIIGVQIALFSVLASLVFFSSFYTNMINAHSRQTFAWGIGLQVLKVVFFLGYIAIILGMQKFSITFLLLGLIASYCIDIFFSRIILQRFTHSAPMH